MTNDEQLAEIIRLLREISLKLDQANSALSTIAQYSGTTY